MTLPIIYLLSYLVKQVDGQLSLVGWYQVKRSNSSCINPELIHRQILEFATDNAIYIVFDFHSGGGAGNALPFKVYETKITGTTTTMEEYRSAIKVEMDEIERLCVKHLVTSATESASISSSSTTNNQAMSFVSSQIKMLELLLERVDFLCDFLGKTNALKRTLSNEQMDLMRSLAEIVNSRSLPNQKSMNDRVSQVMIILF